MARLSRLRLSGIRNFSCENDEDIKFESPVTIFLGQNGSGKTTIIEAIKFALTGELPGGTRSGQGFIYDPQLARKCETRGQVKLKVYDTTGESFTITKVATCKLSKDKLSFNLVDSAIFKGGKTVSGRCAEIHKLVAGYIGIPLPIINYVLFCHQENSYWPLEEPKKLKEKFDAIFDSAKYNKCIENILKLKKNKQIELKTLEVKVDYAEQNKIQMEKKRDQLREKEERLQALENTVAEIELKRKPVEEDFRKILLMEKDINMLSTEVELLRNQLSNLKEQEEEILSNCTEIHCSDEELQEKILKFTTDPNETKNKMNGFEKEIEDINHKESKSRQDANESQTKLAQLQTEKQENVKKVVIRDKKIDEISVLYKITSSNDKTNDITKLDSCIKNAEKGLHDFEQSSEVREREFQDQIDECRTKYTQIKHGIESKQRLIKEYASEGEALSTKLSELNMCDNELQHIETPLRRIENEIKEENSQLDIDNVRKVIEKESDKYKTLDDQLQKIESELQVLQNYSTIQTEVEVQNENLIKRQNDMQKLRLKHNVNFEKIYGNHIPQNNLKSSLEIYIKKQNRVINDTSKKITNMQRDVTKLETNLNTQKEILETFTKDLLRDGQIIGKVFKNETYDSVETKLSKKIDEKQNVRSTLHSSKYLYTKFISQFKSPKPCCPICKRDVAETDVIAKIIKELEKTVKTLPKQHTKAEREVNDLQKEYNKIVTLKPTYDRINQLNETEIPILTEKIKSFEIELSEKTSQLHDHQYKLKSLQTNQTLANTLLGDVTLIDQYQKEIKRTESELITLNAKIPKNVSNRSKQETLREQEDFKSMIRTTRLNIDTLQKKITTHTDRLQSLKDQRNDLKTKELNIKKDLQRKDQLAIKHEEIEAKIAILETEVMEMKTESKPLENKLLELTRQIENTKIFDKKKRMEMTTQFNKSKTTFNKIIGLERSIKEFKDMNIDEKISTVNSVIDEHQKQLSDYSQEKSQIMKNITELRDQINNQKNYHRELQDNVNIRAKRKRMDKLNVDLEISENKLGEHDITSILQQKTKLNKQLTDYDQQENIIRGQKEAQSNFIKEIEKELNHPNYANAASNYKDVFLEYKILGKSIEDLGDFAKGIDWAMLQYHKKQMVAVNQTIRELWRSVYRGNDIDYIAIRTEMDMKSRNDNRRMYNYRLVQVKNSIEMEMRGRCSAGQKVLASLIIRIALADTFSTKCGVLALDEPTTNLDKQNIASLCSALCELINRKRAQKNFQLLIITHDSEFLSNLCREVAIDSYNLVKRNSKGQSTVVNKPNDL